MQKNLPSRRNMFGMNRDDFRRRQSAALSRRLMGALTAKQVAYAIGVHADTILNWSRGTATMDGAAIEALNGFFESMGDWNFIAELYGDIGVKRRQRAAQLQQQAAQLLQQAEWLERTGAAA